jgi:hypothetical protein
LPYSATATSPANTGPEPSSFVLLACSLVVITGSGCAVWSRRRRCAESLGEPQILRVWGQSSDLSVALAILKPARAAPAPQLGPSCEVPKRFTVKRSFCGRGSTEWSIEWLPGNTSSRKEAVAIRLENCLTLAF